MIKIKKPNGYWNYDTCYNAAKECSYRAELKYKYPQAYRISLKQGWINDYTWFKDGKIVGADKRRKYDYQTCYEEAKKYNTITEFENGSHGACIAARTNGWMKDYTWFTILWQEKWNKESCYEEAKKYSTLEDFMSKSNSCYATACKNKWINDYTWLERKRVKPGIWQIYENCYNEALKYKSLTEFENKSSGCYEGARENGWLDSFTWLKDERFDLYTDKIDCVYAYEFKEQNAVYIGRTLMSLQKQRDYQHIFREDSVSKFAKENNIPIPEMKILEDNLTIKEGSENEGIWVELYKEDGWIILNKVKTGGIGGLAKGKYTKKSCYDIAVSYTTLKSFMEEQWSAYRAALKHNWLKDYTWLERKHFQSVKEWTYEMCSEDSKRFKSRGEYAEKSKSSYNKARKEGWIENFIWLYPTRHPKGYWQNYDNCYNEAKKYKRISDFQKESGSAYNVARKNGWLKDYTWFST